MQFEVLSSMLLANVTTTKYGKRRRNDVSCSVRFQRLPARCTKFVEELDEVGHGQMVNHNSILNTDIYR